MSGKLKMEGNLGKAMALEKVMKKMHSRGYHTMTGSRFQSSIVQSSNLNKIGKVDDDVQFGKSKL